MTWTKSDIRKARKIELAPLLIHRGYRLQPLQNGDYGILPDPHDVRLSGLRVKQSFWIWTEENLAGNTIDFFVKVEGKSFHQAMKIITHAPHYDAGEPNPLQTTATTRPTP